MLIYESDDEARLDFVCAIDEQGGQGGLGVRQEFRCYILHEKFICINIKQMIGYKLV